MGRDVVANCKKTIFWDMVSDSRCFFLCAQQQLKNPENRRHPKPYLRYAKRFGVRRSKPLSEAPTS